MDVEHLPWAVPVLVPDPVEDLLPADDPARFERKAGEDVELPAGECDRSFCLSGSPLNTASALQRLA